MPKTKISLIPLFFIEVKYSFSFTCSIASKDFFSNSSSLSATLNSKIKPVSSLFFGSMKISYLP